MRTLVQGYFSLHHKLFELTMAVTHRLLAK